MSTLSSSPDVSHQPEFAQPLMQMITGYWVSQALYALVKQDIPDMLKDGTLPISALAACRQINEDFLYRLLRTAGSLGLLTETADRCFGLTPMGHYLRQDHPASMRAVVLMMGEEHYQAWGALNQGVQTAKTPFEAVYGMPVFDYFSKHPQSSEIFNQAMTALTRNDHAMVAQCYDFSEFGTIVDIGGGHGSLLGAILQQTPQANGVLFDLPHVLEKAPDHLRQLGVAERCMTVGGNFFQSIAAHGDAYVLAHIIHDWSDEKALKILNNLQQVMPAHGKLLLVETVLDAHSPQFPMGTLMDLNMLVMTEGGRERTEAEFAALLSQAGFRLTRVVPGTGHTSLVEAVKA